MLKLNDTKLRECTLVAVAIKDKLNSEHKKNNEIVSKLSKEYWVIDVDNFNPIVFTEMVLRFYEVKHKKMNVNLNSFLKLIPSQYHQQVINAFFSSHELFNNRISYKTKHSKQEVDNFIIDSKYKTLIQIAKVLVETETFVKDLISQPLNYLNADKYEQIIKEKFASLKSKVKISTMDIKQLKAKKMGLILAVGQNSSLSNTPRIICIEYVSDANKPKLALIGKGIMFDTGGLNIKPGEHMFGMHGDMSGSAIVMGAVYAMAKLGIKANIAGLCPIATNEIGPEAYRVNDILTSYEGKTIEITNTDAEGRLVLSDAVAYAHKDLKAKTIMTVATLTGSVIVALGNTYSGIWTNSEQCWTNLQDASIASGEALWRMPLHTDYIKKLDSKIADYINCSRDREAGSNVAAEFIRLFSGNANFIHADIAGSNERKTTFVPVLLRTLFYLAQK